MVVTSDKVDTEKIDTAMRHFDLALKANRDRDYVRESQFRILANKRPLSTHMTLQIANNIRKEGEDLCLAARRTILDVYKDLWYDEPHLEANVQKVLSALPPEDLLQTYRWCKSRLDMQKDTGTSLIFQFVEIRLIENTGDLKKAAFLYSELLDEIDEKKPWMKGYRNRHREKIERFYAKAFAGK